MIASSSGWKFSIFLVNLGGFVRRPGPCFLAGKDRSVLGKTVSSVLSMAKTSGIVFPNTDLPDDE